jgi:hypothetical protein
MPPIRTLITALLLLAGALAAPTPARAETFNTCAGFITAVPAVITTQGVWCMNKDLATAITSGNAITINTNNVTIDCNDFKLGGLAAGDGSRAIGIYALNRQNATVRHCNVRGFFTGISLGGIPFEQTGGGHLVEDNRLDNNLYIGIGVEGDNNRVRRNAVYDTGGATGEATGYGIFASANLVDNIVSGVFADAADGTLYGIQSIAMGAEVRGNTVSGFDKTARQGGAINQARGIAVGGAFSRLSGNQIVGDRSDIGDPVSGNGIYATALVYCIDNTVGGFATNIDPNCRSSENVSL